TDVDWYQFTIDYQFIQSLSGVDGGPKTWATIFDIDYADGLSRPDTILSVFDSDGRLIYVGRDSDIADDQSGPEQGADFDDLTRGSFGKLDPYIGSIHLEEGDSKTYYVAVSSNAFIPSVLDFAHETTPTNPNVRLEPVTSLKRIVEDHIGFVGYTSNPRATSRIDVLPENGPIFDISSTISLSTHVRPFQLSDVPLYLSSGNTLRVVDASTGTSETTFPTPLNPQLEDIAMRDDGRLFGVRNGPLGSNDAQFVEIDPATGAVTLIGPDGILDDDIAVSVIDALAI